MIRKYHLQIKASFYTSMVVGTLLIFFNHLQVIISLSFTASDLLEWLVNFIVPFLVSLYSRIAALKKEKGPKEFIDA